MMTAGFKENLWGLFLGPYNICYSLGKTQAEAWEAAIERMYLISKDSQPGPYAATQKAMRKKGWKAVRVTVTLTSD